jgi:AraC family transcriptional regulator
MLLHCSLFAAGEFEIARCDHPSGHEHCDPAEEISSDYSVNRVEFGEFTLQVDGQQWRLSPGDLFLTYPGMAYRCRHHEVIPTDVCLSVSFFPQDDSAEISAFKHAARTLPVHPPSNRLAYLFLLATRRPSEPMAAEEAVHELIAAALKSWHPGKSYRDHQLSWYAERVDTVRQQLDGNYSAEHRLSNLARSVGMSPFHFARIFRELTGIPPHSYLRRTRLRQAARRLRDGASVTEACFASGFQNLSHFSRQFYRHFGVRPSLYAAKLR